MKKIYVPTYDDLYKMQDMGANIYKYLFIKAIETIILDGIKYRNKGMLKSAYKYLRENPDFAQAICRLYPEEIQYSEIAQYDVNLCKYIIEYNSDNSIYSLNNLSNFMNSTIKNSHIISSTISTLYEKLPNTPKYRFEYKENNLLDSIFGCELTSDYISVFLTKELKAIEPAYVLKFMDDHVPINKSPDELLKNGIDEYAARYGVRHNLGKEYIGKDILTNPVQEVKRLIKCIKTQ